MQGCALLLAISSLLIVRQNEVNHQSSQILFSALIINAVGLVLSLIVFVIEILIHKTSLRHAGGVTQDRLEVDHYYQSGDREEPSLSVVKTVRVGGTKFASKLNSKMNTPESCSFWVTDTGNISFSTQIHCFHQVLAS